MVGVFSLTIAGVLMVWYGYAIFQGGRGLGFILIGVGISLLVATGLHKIAIGIADDHVPRRFFKWCYILAASPIVLMYIWAILTPDRITAPTMVYFLIGAPFLFAAIILPVTMPPVIVAHILHIALIRRKRRVANKWNDGNNS